MDDKSVKPTGKTFTKRTSNKPWWIILAVYLIILVFSGYIAFIRNEGNMALDMKDGELVAAFSDETTKARLLEAIRTDEEVQAKREDLALQAFNVSLGALLGFLTSSAASRRTTGKNKP